MTTTEIRMPPVGADVHLSAYCRGCGRSLGRSRFVWDDEPRTFSSHICGGNAQDVVFEMEWTEVGESVDVSGPR